MTKMPVEYFEYYSMVDPFAMGYYGVGKKEKARLILSQLIKKYQENLTFYSGYTLTEQYFYASDIVTDIEQYRGILEIAKNANDSEFYNKEKVKFNNYNKMFNVFNRKME